VRADNTDRDRDASSDAGHAYVPAFLDAIERQIDDRAEGDRVS
jgi:hypothetical protein